MDLLSFAVVGLTEGVKQTAFSLTWNFADANSIFIGWNMLARARELRMVSFIFAFALFFQNNSEVFRKETTVGVQAMKANIGVESVFLL